MKRLFLGSILTLMLLFTVGRTEAQILVGPHLGYNIDNEHTFVGLDVVVSPPAFPLQIQPSAGYFLSMPGDSKLIVADVNLIYPFGVSNALFTPYAGAGLGMDFFDPGIGDMDTEIGVNVVGGARFGFGGLQPFGEARINFVNGEVPVDLRVGLLFGF